MSTTTHVSPLPETGPYDDRGRLVHEDDAAAQLALALVGLEQAVAEAGRPVTDVRRIQVRSVDVRLLDDVIDVLTERLDDLGCHPEIEVVSVDSVEVPGTLVTLQASLTHLTKETGMTIDTPAHPADSLRGLCGGRVHLPGDPGYDAARLPWNVAVDQRPAAVAVPHSADEVAEVVRAAAAAGLRVAPQSTGHSAAPLAAAGLDDVVIVRMSELSGVVVDPTTCVARVHGGTMWQAVVEAAAAHGLAALHGSSPDVAVAGYALGGGMSFYAREHGLAANSIVAVEVVTADGTLVRADADHHADLFWALRGGGGNFGVVTAIELRLLPIRDVVAGMLLWDRERAPEVVRAWVDWTREVPDSVTTALRVMSFPLLPDLPPFLSGRQLVVIDGAVLETDERAAELLAPLRALGPEMDTFARVPARTVTEVHMDPPGPTPAIGDGDLLGPLDEEAVATLLSLVGPGTTPALLFAELRHLGGSVGRPAVDGGALSYVAGEYALHCIAIAPTPEAAAAGSAEARRVIEALAPWSAGTQLLNFVDRPCATETAFTDESWQRLQQIRAKVDPTRLFLANHPV